MTDPSSPEMALILRALQKVLKSRFKADLITTTTDLAGQEILDSLDAMRFIFELERGSGARFPQFDLAEQGYFKIDKLIEYLRAA